MSNAPNNPVSLPADWLKSLRGTLENGEEVRLQLGLDLSTSQRFAQGWVVVTDQRLLSQVVEQPENSANPQPTPHWQAWKLTEIAAVCIRDDGGLGRIDFLGPEQLLATFRFTPAVATPARRFVTRLQAILAGKPIHESEEATVCPSCGSVLGPDDITCPSCTPAAQAPPAQTLLRLAVFAKRQTSAVALGFMLTLASMAATLVPPYLTMPLIDDVLLKKPVDLKLVGYYLGGMVIAAVLAWALSWGKLYVLAWSTERVLSDLRSSAFAHLTRLSLEYFGAKRTGDLISRISSDSDRISSFLSVTLVEFATDLLMIIAIAVILVSINPWLALVTLAPYPIIAWLTVEVRKQLRHGFLHSGRAWGMMTNVLTDAIPGIRVVKAFAQERREVARFNRANATVVEANDRVNRIWSFFTPMVNLLSDAGLLIVWAFAAWQIAQGQLSVGALSAFIAYISRFYARLDSMSRMLASTQRAAASTHRIFEIFDRVPSVAEPVHPTKITNLQGKIEIRDATFSYGSRQVIRGVNLTINPGEMIGLVGPSGAGKSTLVNLVCRFYDVSGGSISVDGTDVRSFGIEDYRRHIGIVLQEPLLFFGSIAENIAYARPDATRAQIIAAAKASKAHDFILRLPDGYDSIVGERGQLLSGGERQRISIARALLTDPKILILDEATSSVDTETEREIQEALDVLVRGRTTIAIAHRLSTLRNASRIVVMEEGQVTEVGDHNALLERDGAYARLHQAQYQLLQEAG